MQGRGRRNSAISAI